MIAKGQWMDVILNWPGFIAAHRHGSRCFGLEAAALVNGPADGV